MNFLDLAYELSPFLFAMLVKTATTWGVPLVVKNQLPRIPGADELNLTDRGVSTNLTAHVLQAEQQVVLPITLVASAALGVVKAVQEGKSGVAALLGLVFAALAVASITYLFTRESGSLSQPAWRRARFSAEALLFGVNIAVDLVMIGFIMYVTFANAPASSIP